MTDKDVKQIPYGISDYEQIRLENYYYVDKTAYLRTIKQTGRYLFFIRPRRFGKSLFLSMMEYYYDIAYKDKFAELFSGTDIYRQPTVDRGAYLLLKFNFSIVEPAPDKFESSFLSHVRGEVDSFIRKYSEYLLKDRDFYLKTVYESQSASDILSTLARLCRDSRQKLYVILDEYDNFANTILSTTGSDAYEKLTRGAGSFRSFFNVMKSGTGGSGAPFSRLFMTGVSPITLDDVTSGYNIGENVSLDSAFNRMLGFTENDVREILDYYKSVGCIKHDTESLMEIIRLWYGNYLFSEHSDEHTRLYNPDMVLFFIKQYLKNKSVPGHLVDRNVRIDYGKLRHLIVIDKNNTRTTNGNFSKLKEIIEKGETTAKLEKGFPLEQLNDSLNFKSLLFYFGLLTIKSIEGDMMKLAVPNETVKVLYYDYISEAYRETDVFAMDLSFFSELVNNMAFKGEWGSLFDYLSGRMRESISLRDLIMGERAIQAFLNVYLGLSNLYIIHAEKELNKGFADLVLEPFLARYEGIKYSYLLEIKYIKRDEGSKGALQKKIQQQKKEAETQLKSYSADEKFRKTVGKTTLVKLVLIFHGHELVYIGSVD